LNVEAHLQNNTPWAKKGFTVAREQFVLHPYDFPNVSIPLINIPIKYVKESSSFVATTNDGFVTIDNNGALTSWIVNGKEVLKAPLEPYFWKPENDNQHAAHFAERTSIWKDAAEKRTVKRIRNEKNKVIVEMTLPVGADLILTYTLMNTGSIMVDMDYRPSSTLSDGNTEGKIPLMPKFGMRMRLPANYTQIHYYGRGPWENYPDRKHSAFLGEYKMPISEYETEYIHPQDNGNRCDVRWFEIGSSSSKLRIDGCQPLCIRAWDYGEEDLVGAQHPHEIKRGDFINLNIDLNVHGVGGTDTWGKLTLPQYTIDGNKPHRYSFILSIE
jgi:beta-galactosidase